MDDTPTTDNGPLHTTELDRSDRRITALFDTEAEAKDARDKLVAAGVGTYRITLQPARQNEAVVSSSQAPDRTILGKLRDAMLPEEGMAEQRDALAKNRYVVDVEPDSSDTDAIVGILEASHPRNFDARLQRWRNA